MRDLASGEGASRERNLGYVGVCGNGMADGVAFSSSASHGGLIFRVIVIMNGGRTVSVDNVNDTWGKSGVVYQAGELECREGGEFGGLVGGRVRPLGGILRGSRPLRQLRSLWPALEQS